MFFICFWRGYTVLPLDYRFYIRLSWKLGGCISGGDGGILWAYSPSTSPVIDAEISASCLDCLVWTDIVWDITRRIQVDVFTSDTQSDFSRQLVHPMGLCSLNFLEFHDYTVIFTQEFLDLGFSCLCQWGNLVVLVGTVQVRVGDKGDSKFLLVSCLEY